MDVQNAKNSTFKVIFFTQINLSLAVCLHFSTWIPPGETETEAEAERPGEDLCQQCQSCGQGATEVREHDRGTQI